MEVMLWYTLSNVLLAPSSCVPKLTQGSLAELQPPTQMYIEKFKSQKIDNDHRLDGKQDFGNFMKQFINPGDRRYADVFCRTWKWR